ncbi:hypothetical protein DES53_102728 [Roseimicrobium gellanilyticum]|uniref:NfeD-like partner-binding protein n=1 Tax=Roseimicrobium gellanilyticum TaxID=748857 RepID=A0A366HTB2_9BACT|nr:hypothetical protein [Roseimicrobium gellanilyticum]RBP46338.1 hypothetical protein DES53_102728 [Roseimicrobium gellanilyticum]
MFDLFDWSTLGLLQKVFAVIGLTSLALIILTTFMSLVGGDVHHDFEVTADHGDIGHTWGLFSVRGMLGLMLGLGFGGLIALDKGLGGVLATFIGLGVGIVIAFGLALLMRVFQAARADGTISLQNAVGQTGNVYQRVPAKRDGIGKVQVMVQGRLQMIEACTDSENDLMPQKHIKVTGVVSGNTLLVE